MPIYSDDPEEEYRIEQIFEELKKPTFFIGCLPHTLDLEQIRKRIPHTAGEHPPNDKGELLCNGHCKWKKCSHVYFQCENCGYIECECCLELFFLELEGKVFGELMTGGNYFCRNCGHIDSMEEYN